MTTWTDTSAGAATWGETIFPGYVQPGYVTAGYVGGSTHYSEVAAVTKTWTEVPPA